MQVKTLENGMRVLVREQHASELVSLQCWVGVGSLHELESERGMSHLIEHMLFKGTAKRETGQIAKEIGQVGGSVNAFTTFDATVFYTTLGSEHFEVGCDVLSDAVFSSAFDADELAREKEVVVEEIRRSLDNPATKVSRALFAQAYRGCEAERPILGDQESVEGFSREDLVGFYRRWYLPENMCLVVAGDVELEKTLELAERYFGAPVSGSLPTKDSVNLEPLSGAPVLLKESYEQPRFEIGFRGPSLDHPDAPALDLACFILGSGESSRLHRALKMNSNLAAGVGSSFYGPGFGGLFMISCAPFSETFEPAFETCLVEVMRLCQTGVSPEELARAQCNLRVDRYHQDETVGGLARSLGFGMATRYGPVFEDVYLASIERTTIEDVRRVARQYLAPRPMIVVGMVHSESELEQKDLVRTIEKARSSASAAGSSASSVKSVDEVTSLGSGLRFVYHQQESPFFNLIAVSEGGQRVESKKNFGEQYCSMQMLATATDRLDQKQLAEFVEDRGSILGAFSGKDSSGVQLQCLPEQAETFVGLLAESLRGPIFNEDRWDQEQREILQQIVAQGDQPSSICFRRMQELLFGEHPYRSPLYGQKNTVEGYSASELLGRYKDWAKSGPWVIAAVGPGPRDQTEAMLERAFADFEFAQERLAISGAPESPAALSEHIELDREQTHICVAYPGLSWADENRAALDVLGSILGGQGGRLFLNLRDKESLAYTVAPLVQFGVERYLFGAYIACAPSKREQAIEGIERELVRLCEEDVGCQELERAKNMLKGALASEMQRGENKAMSMALMELYGLGANHYLGQAERLARVSKEQIKSLARTLVNPNHRVVISVGRSISK